MNYRHLLASFLFILAAFNLYRLPTAAFKFLMNDFKAVYTAGKTFSQNRKLRTSRRLHAKDPGVENIQKLARFRAVFRIARDFHFYFGAGMQPIQFRI